MRLFRRERAIEVTALSGTLRVAVAPKLAWILLLIESGGLLIFCFFAFRNWVSMPLWNRAVLIWIVVGAVVAFLHQLSGSEVVEFDAEKLCIGKSILGLTRTSGYLLDRCQGLEWHDESSEGENSGLQCKVGWRTVTFAKYISEDEATEILIALQKNLPDVATRLLASPDSSKKHFTMLNLS